MRPPPAPRPLTVGRIARRRGANAVPPAALEELPDARVRRLKLAGDPPRALVGTAAQQRDVSEWADPSCAAGSPDVLIEPALISAAGTHPPRSNASGLLTPNLVATLTPNQAAA